MACSSEIHPLSSAAWFIAAHHAAPPPQADALMLFGFLSAFAAGVCYLHRHDSRIAMLTFAASLAATGIYGFVEGAWPLGILETAWALRAAKNGLKGKTLGKRRRLAFLPDLESRQSRYREIFGSN